MFIAHVTFQVSPGQEAEIREALAAGAVAVDAMKGCKRFVAFEELAVDGGFGILHEWDSEADFSRYLASGAFSTLGRAIRPLAIAQPVSKRFNAVPVQALR